MIDKEIIKEAIIAYKGSIEGFEECFDAGKAKIEAINHILKIIDSLPKEPSKNLNEEIENYIKDSLAIKFPTTDKEQIKADIRYIALHFAEWQKQQMKETLQTEYEKGRFDMREEMMKDVVEGEVVYKIGNAEIAPTDVRYKVMSDRVYIPNVKLGDKVKIIICKPEQQ